MSRKGVILEEDRLVMLDDVCDMKGRLVDSLDADKNLIGVTWPVKPE